MDRPIGQLHFTCIIKPETQLVEYALCLITVRVSSSQRVQSSRASCIWIDTDLSIIELRHLVQTYSYFYFFLFCYLRFTVQFSSFYSSSLSCWSQQWFFVSSPVQLREDLELNVLGLQNMISHANTSAGRFYLQLGIHIQSA